VITNADAALFLIPEWTLTRNDTDPDATDSLNVNSVTGTAGLDAGFLFGFLVAQDDGTLGGSFDYDTTDGMAVSAGSGTVTVTNNAASTTVLTGTSGDDIIIGTVGGETLAGAAGSDILVVNSGSHTLTGGSGDDIFAFEVVPDGANSITDFDNVVDDDLIAISASAFGGGLTAGMDVASVFESSSDGAFIVPESRFHYNTSSGELLYSSDGGMSVAVVATLQAGVLLNASDLLIV
jgi:Ca2+-binding RTX toxin-like protein